MRENIQREGARERESATKDNSERERERREVSETERGEKRESGKSVHGQKKVEGSGTADASTQLESVAVGVVQFGHSCGCLATFQRLSTIIVYTLSDAQFDPAWLTRVEVERHVKQKRRIEFGEKKATRNLGTYNIQKDILTGSLQCFMLEQLNTMLKSSVWLFLFYLCVTWGRSAHLEPHPTVTSQ